MNTITGVRKKGENLILSVLDIQDLSAIPFHAPTASAGFSEVTWKALMSISTKDKNLSENKSLCKYIDLLIPLISEKFTLLGDHHQRWDPLHLWKHIMMIQVK